MGIYLPGGRSANSLHINGKTVTSAWMNGELVWSKGVESEMTDGVKWEQMLPAIDSATTFHGYMSNHGMKAVTSDWSFTSKADLAAISLTPAPPYDGRVAFMMEDSAVPDASPEWLAEFGLALSVVITAKNQKVYATETHVGILNDAGDPVVVLKIPSDDMSENPRLAFKAKSGGEVEVDIPAFPKIPRYIPDQGIGIVHLWYHDGKIEVFLAFEKVASVDIPTGAASLSRVRPRVGVSIPRLTAVYEGAIPVWETAPFLDHVFIYTGWTGHDKATSYGFDGSVFRAMMPNDGGVENYERTTSTAIGARYIDIVVLGAGGGGGGGNGAPLTGSFRGYSGTPGSLAFTTWKCDDSNRVLNITFGRGGSGGNGWNHYGASGGATSVTSSRTGYTISADGGKGGKWGELMSQGNGAWAYPSPLRVFKSVFPDWGAQYTNGAGAPGGNGTGGGKLGKTGGVGTVWFRQRF